MSMMYWAVEVDNGIHTPPWPKVMQEQPALPICPSSARDHAVPWKHPFSRVLFLCAAPAPKFPRRVLENFFGGAEKVFSAPLFFLPGCC